MARQPLPVDDADRAHGPWRSVRLVMAPSEADADELERAPTVAHGGVRAARERVDHPGGFEPLDDSHLEIGRRRADHELDDCDEVQLRSLGCGAPRIGRRAKVEERVWRD